MKVLMFLIVGFIIFVALVSFWSEVVVKKFWPEEYADTNAALEKHNAERLRRIQDQDWWADLRNRPEYDPYGNGPV